MQSLDARTSVIESKESASNRCSSAVTYMHEVTDDSSGANAKPSVSSSASVNDSSMTSKVRSFLFYLNVSNYAYCL